MPWSRYVIGCHGCEARLAQRVAAGEATLSPSTNDYDWLGHGRYFWEESVQRAYLWAESESQRQDRRIEQPGVLGAIIDLGHCLNLMEAENLRLVGSAYEGLTEFMRELGQLMPRNTGQEFRARKLDCAVFEALHFFRENESLRPFDTVRAFFVEGEPLYPGAGLRQLDHIQICVRNPSNIVGYFLPKLN